MMHLAMHQFYDTLCQQFIYTPSGRSALYAHTYNNLFVIYSTFTGNALGTVDRLSTEYIFLQKSGLPCCAGYS